MKSYQEIDLFLRVANNWLKRHPKESKFRYALSKATKSAAQRLGEYQEQLEEINIDNCAVDDKGVILRDENGGFRFSKEGLKANNKKVNELFKSSSVEIEPYYATQIPDEEELSLDERDIFTGFCLRELEEAAPELVNGKTASADEAVN